MEIAITGFGDQDCSTGSNELISQTAEELTVEVCVTEAGSPVSGHVLFLHVTHSDGTTETLDKQTDTEGKARFTVRPTAAGTTTATVCDDQGCYGEVALEAAEPPRPEAVATYAPTGDDIGPTASIADGPTDMVDAYTGDTARPEDAARHDGADIASFSYAGNADGDAIFKIVTVGNGRALFDQGPPRREMSASVATPDGGRYTIGVSNSGGHLASGAASSGAVLEGVDVTLEWADDNTACLRVAGFGIELERAERLEALYTDHMRTGDLAETATDFWYFNDWHRRTFGEPWFRWSTATGVKGVLDRGLNDIAQGAGDGLLRIRTPGGLGGQ